jgi:hypothetical protein
MACAEVCRAISDGDRRVLRGRRVRAHLRDCASCSGFAAAIGARQVEMRAIVPVLPAAASAIVLARAMESALGAGAVGAGGAATGGAATGGTATGGAAAASTAGKAAGVAILSKGFATASVLATAAVTVGGVAAVVRIDASRRPARSHSAQVARPGVRDAQHVAAHTSTSSVSGAGAATVRGTQAGAGAGTGLVRHVRFVYSHGHGRPGGWHRWSTAAGPGEWRYGPHGGAVGGLHGHGGGWHGHSDRSGGSNGRGWALGHGQGAVPGIRHDTLVGYAGERGHDRGHGGRALGHHK